MSDLPFTATADVRLSSGDQTTELVEQKLASAEKEMCKLHQFLAESGPGINHIDGCLPHDNTSCGDSASEAVTMKFRVISPLFVDVPDTGTSQSALVSRICRLESSVTLFRDAVARISRERDSWRSGKLQSDENFAHAVKAFKMEIAWLRQDAENKRGEVTDTKENADKVAERLRGDLLQTIGSIVCIAYVAESFCLVKSLIFWKTWKPARKMSVDIDATPDLLLLIQQKLRMMRYRYGSLSMEESGKCRGICLVAGNY